MTPKPYIVSGIGLGFVAGSIFNFAYGQNAAGVGLLTTGFFLNACAWLLVYITHGRDVLDAKINVLVNETRDALQSMRSDHAGMRDTIRGFHSDMAALQKDLAEFEVNMGSDEVKKFADRMSVIEFAVGIKRGQPSNIRIVSESASKKE